MVDKLVQAITVVVPRRFYVNFLSEPPRELLDGWPGASRSCVKVILPRSKPALHTHEFKMPEVEFQRRQKNLSELTTNPIVEGVYETKVPPSMRALVALGCVCRVSQKARRLAGRLDRWNLDDLEFVNATTVPYLVQPLRKIYVYQSSCQRGQGAILSVLGVYLVEEKRIYVYVANPFAEASMPNVAHILTERTPDFDVRVTRVSGIDQAQKDVSALLSAFHSQGNRSHLLVT
jgi:DNA polymerase epsilon subunit 1